MTSLHLEGVDTLCPGLVGNNYLPANYWPHPAQFDFLRRSIEGALATDPKDVYEALFGGAAGGGKALAVDTPIPTPDRGFVAMGDLKAGDYVLSRHGWPTRVEEAYDVSIVPGYRLTFDDGSQVVACDDHKWLTFDAAELEQLTKRTPEYRAKRRSSRPSKAMGRRSEAFTLAVTERNKRLPTPTKPPPSGSVRTTSEIARTLMTKRGRRNHAVPVAGQAEVFLPDTALPVDPYLLGCWLGDGTSAAGSVTSADEEILDAFAAEYPKGKSCEQRGAAVTQSYLGLRPALRRIGVFRNKHVPDTYLWSSPANRLALLQGLMDTDGTADRAAYFTSTNHRLAKAVAILVRGLGMKARIVEGRARLDGKDCGPKWDVAFTPNRPVFRLQRKLDRMAIATRRTTKFRYVVSADRVPAQPMRCIRVAAGDGLFLATENFIPTHNSGAVLIAAAQMAWLYPGSATAILRRSMPELEKPGGLWDRALEWWSAMDGADVNGTKHIIRFPNGSKIQFGYHHHKKHDSLYQGGEYQLVIFDELTFWESSHAWLHLRSRMRRPEGSGWPLRLLATSNPGGPGHQWVKERFVGGTDPETGAKIEPAYPYFPSRIEDNPTLDGEAYRRTLSHLRPARIEQLMNGDWDAREPGDYFQAEWFGPLIDPKDKWPTGMCVRVRSWDLAASTDASASETAGVLMARSVRGARVVEDCKSFRLVPGARDARILQIAKMDGPTVVQHFEVEPGSGGQAQVDNLVNRIKRGVGCKVSWARPKAEQTDKEAKHVLANPEHAKGKTGRAEPASACVYRGHVRRGEAPVDPNNPDPEHGADYGRGPVDQRDGIMLMAGPWTEAFLLDHELFPVTAEGNSTKILRADKVDAMVGAYKYTEAHPPGTGGVPSAPPEYEEDDDLDDDERVDSGHWVH